MKVHGGHLMYVNPGEEPFLTPEVIQSFTLTAPREQIIEQIRAMEAAGLKEVAFCILNDYARKMIEELSGRSWRSTNSFGLVAGLRARPAYLKASQSRCLSRNTWGGSQVQDLKVYTLTSIKRGLRESNGVPGSWRAR